MIPDAFTFRAVPGGHRLRWLSVEARGGLDQASVTVISEDGHVHPSLRHALCAATLALAGLRRLQRSDRQEVRP